MASGRSDVSVLKENLLLKAEVLELKRLVEFYREQSVLTSTPSRHTATQTDCACECRCGVEEDYEFVPDIGMYYSRSTGYYFNPATSLFYNAGTQQYYHYDAVTGELTQYAPEPAADPDALMAVSELVTRVEQTLCIGTDAPRKRPAPAPQLPLEREEGECSSDEGEDVQILELSSQDYDAPSEDFGERYAPCVRAVAVESDVLTRHSLTVVTIDGAVIGSEPACDVHLPSASVSKRHCRLAFDGTAYSVEDLQSLLGTYLNDEQLPPHQHAPLRHQDTLRVGATTFSVHIHVGANTCARCEPGLLAASEPDLPGPSSMREEPREARRRRENTELRRQYGLLPAAAEDARGLHGLARRGYRDRAQNRRQIKGSDNPHEPDAAPASVHRELPSENKGFKMLAKMGWAKGAALGKSGTGITEPINQTGYFGGGLGSAHAARADAGDAASIEKRRRLATTAARYRQLPP